MTFKTVVRTVSPALQADRVSAIRSTNDPMTGCRLRLHASRSPWIGRPHSVQGVWATTIPGVSGCRQRGHDRTAGRRPTNSATATATAAAARIQPRTVSATLMSGAYQAMRRGWARAMPARDPPRQRGGGEGGGGRGGKGARSTARSFRRGIQAGPDRRGPWRSTRACRTAEPGHHPPIRAVESLRASPASAYPHHLRRRDRSAL